MALRYSVGTKLSSVVAPHRCPGDRHLGRGGGGAPFQPRVVAAKLSASHWAAAPCITPASPEVGTGMSEGVPWLLARPREPEADTLAAPTCRCRNGECGLSRCGGYWRT
jgi:hypothetical protein